MPFDDSLLNDVLDHADIVHVVSSFIPVIKKGKNYVAKCPFHDDTNPSMSVSPERKMFKCFVCGTGGSAISFVQKYLHIPFVEAMKKVADISGYHDERLDKKQAYVKPEDPEKIPLFKCLKDLTLYYQYSLNTAEGKDGLEYFKSRNLDKSLQDKFLLGYAPKDGQATCQFLQSKGHSLKTIEDVGIATMINGNYSDKNQGRTIFPVCDTEGRVIGFSARKIGDGPEAKYVNSPETLLFHKSSVLYNYHIAKEKARIANCIYVCEGFMDVMALSKIGIDNAVALMGTALSSEHIAMLRLLNVEVRLCLDGDLPGQTAMMKASKMLQEAGIPCVIVDNQGSTEDPDDIINKEGPDALRVYLQKLLNRVDFALKYFKRSNPLKTAEQKKKLISEFIPVLLGIKDQLDLDNYLHQLSGVTGYDVDSLRSLLKQIRSEQARKKPEDIIRTFHPERKVLRRLEMAEREFLYQMLQNKEAVSFYEDKLSGFYDEIYRQIANYLVDYMQNHDDLEPVDVLASMEASDLENKDVLINEITTLYLEKTHPQHCSKELLGNLLEAINDEKERIFEQDTLERSLAGKSELEKARILAEYNRRKAKKT
ncbi:MAG TPA: DNA primase [Bacilli bacterium]|jgi:DNA primase|nr:DNA primase [Bacilli bacterium]HPY79473.1 DNA primase [Bacilli bacterium]HQA55541.1 DNA primase [Bacilli bacterium]